MQIFYQFDINLMQEYASTPGSTEEDFEDIYNDV